MRSILILDDHAGFRKLLRLHLTSRWPGIRIVESDPAVEGQTPTGYNISEFDLILLDYQLGSLNGFDFLRHFRTLDNCPPVIMLTGEGNERLAVEAIKLGATDYIPKQQMTHDILVRAVQEARDARGAVERLERAAPVPVSIPERNVRIKGLNLLRKLAEGGMSTIYLSERSGSGEQVVLKVSDLRLTEENEASATERFAREYEILRRLQHPNVVRIFEQGFTDEFAFITMEYLGGGSLRERVRDRLAPSQAIDYTLRIAEALQVVHESGVIHRDIKPHNIMFRTDDSMALIDFGVAKSLRESSDLTRVGQILGTPHYISPEQIDGLVPDARSDLYSLGAIFFELLADCVPYAARTPLAVMYKHKHAPIPQLPEQLQSFQPIVNRLLAKNPDERYGSAAELCAVLEARR